MDVLGIRCCGVRFAVSRLSLEDIHKRGEFVPLSCHCFVLDPLFDWSLDVRAGEPRLCRLLALGEHGDSINARVMGLLEQLKLP